MSGNDNADVKVLVDLDRYEEMLRKEEHYDNIVRAALNGVELSNWRERGFDIDMDEVKSYIMIVERDMIMFQKGVLETRRDNELKTVTIKEGEV